MRTMENRSGKRTRLHTFVICAYEESPFLRECVKSLLGQTVRSRIVIATSTPNAHITRIAEEFGLRIAVNEKKQGLAADWNYALGQAKTPLVTLAHQDDVYEKTYTESILKAFRKERDAILFFTDYMELRQEAQGRWRTTESPLGRVKQLMLCPLRWRALQRSRWVRRRILSFGNAICCPSVTYVMNRMPGQVFQDGMKSNIDWQAWERLSREKGAFVYLPQPLMKHRIHTGSTTSSLVEDHARREEDLNVLRLFWPGRIPELIWKAYGKNERFQ